MVMTMLQPFWLIEAVLERGGSISLTYCLLMHPSDRKVSDARHDRRLRCGSSCDFSPNLEALDQLLSGGLGREAVASRADMRRHRTVGREEALRVSWGLESRHALLPLVGRLVGIFRTSIEVSVLPVFHARQDLALGSPKALGLISNDYARDIA
jgi:hypothetical protein